MPGGVVELDTEARHEGLKHRLCFDVVAVATHFHFFETHLHRCL